MQENCEKNQKLWFPGNIPRSESVNTLIRMWVESDPIINIERMKTQSFSKYCKSLGHTTRYCKSVHTISGSGRRRSTFCKVNNTINKLACKFLLSW